MSDEIKQELEEDKTTISTEEIVKKNKTEKLDPETEIKKNELLKKKDEVDWSKIEYEKDNPELPVLTDEDIGIFSAVSDGLIDDDTIYVWVSIAKNQITEYSTNKAILIEAAGKEENLDKEDKSYLDSLEQAKKESILLLAIIQQEARTLREDFTKDKVAENTIKAISLAYLRDCVVEKYRFSDLGDDHNISKDEYIKMNRTKSIQDRLLKNMYVLPNFEEYEHRYHNSSDYRVRKYNHFGANSFNSIIYDIIQALKIYVYNSDKTENIQISDIMNKDFEVMNFIDKPIYSAYMKFDNPDNKTINIDNVSDELKKSFDEIVNLNGKIDDSLFKELFDKCESFINNVLENPNVMDKLIDLAKRNVANDSLYKQYLVSNKITIDEDYESIMSKLIDNIPDINGKSLGKWSIYYDLVSKINRCFDFVKVKNVINSEESDSKDKHRIVFNMLISLLSFEYYGMFGSLVSSLNDFLKNSGHNKESRSFVFKSVMNSLILQHIMGYKSKFDPETEASGDNIYELAKRVMGESYKYIIVEKEDDILLKDVNLIDTRTNYYKLIMIMIDNLNTSFDLVKNELQMDKFMVDNGNTIVITPKTTKNKSKRRHSGKKNSIKHK